MDIKASLDNIRQSLPESVTLVAVSKFHSISELKTAYDHSQRIFGESHVQELLVKKNNLPDDIEWHFIGHLQTNKVKMIVPFVSLIHAVDSLKLLKEINKQAEKSGRVVDCLLELHVAEEESKYGFSEEELFELFRSGECDNFKSIRLRGLMCMATYTIDQEQIRNEFRKAKTIFDKIRDEYLTAKDQFSILSMGMSNDYKIAIEEGSTMVRVGSSIFGERDYTSNFNPLE